MTASRSRKPVHEDREPLNWLPAQWTGLRDLCRTVSPRLSLPWPNRPPSIGKTPNHIVMFAVTVSSAIALRLSLHPRVPHETRGCRRETRDARESESDREPVAQARPRG